jgi:hypothetical protein
VSSLQAEPVRLAFQSAGPGLYDFDTGALRGRLKLDGHYQGLYPLVEVNSGIELVHPPGVFSFYRVFQRGRRYGEAARDWPTASRLLPDGAVEVRWPASADHPLEMTGAYRWKAADTLDLEIAVRPRQAMPRFELFMSSYFTKTFRASAYLKPNGPDRGPPRFVPVDRPPHATGAYVMFPRDEAAVQTIQDGRWKLGSNPVDWAIERWLAAPIILRRDESRGLTAITMCPPDECFAVSSPWNPPSLDGGGYRSVYLSLFGRDLRAGETARAHCRLVIGRNVTDQEALRRYQDYVRPGGR